MNTETNYAEHFYTSINNNSEIVTKNVEEYPFSALGRFLLLYQSKKSNDPSFEQLAKQSAIYFNNIPWIQYQLSGIKHDSVAPENEHQTLYAADEQKANISEQPFKYETETLGFSEEGSQHAPENESHQTHYVADEQKTDISDQPIKYETETLGFSEEGSQHAPENESHQTHYAVDEQKTDVSEQPIKYETETLGFSEEGSQHVPENELHQTHYAADEQKTDISAQYVKYETETLGVSEEESQHAPENESRETHYAADEQKADISNQPIKYETETLGVSEEETLQTSEDKSHESHYAADEPAFFLGSQKDGNFIQESENEEVIAFEPLHTVDYFASQGIKISEEALENDHLGQQVKSFTAWLKSMKKLHPGQLPEQNEVIEKIIQSSAEVSNQSANILTEAMAEVLIKQGKSLKAIEMYEKLSLMNPSKSAYFAAKIESLKTI